MSAKNSDQISVHDLLQQISDYSIDPKILNKEQRQACVEELNLKGWLTLPIAKHLKVSDRTIRRDLEYIRDKNRVRPSHQLTEELVGEWIKAARVSIARQRQISLSSNSTASDKIKAERYVCAIYSDLVEKLSVIGYLAIPPLESNSPGKQSEDKNPLDENTMRILRSMSPMDREKFRKGFEKRTARMLCGGGNKFEYRIVSKEDK